MFISAGSNLLPTVYDPVCTAHIYQDKIIIIAIDNSLHDRYGICGVIYNWYV